MIPNRASDAGPGPTRDYRSAAPDPTRIILDVEITLKHARRLDPIDGYQWARQAILDCITDLQSAIEAMDARHEAYEAAQDPDAGRDDHSGEE